MKMSEVEKASKLKGLNTKKTHAKQTAATLAQEIKTLSDRLDALNAQCSALNDEVAGYDEEIKQLSIDSKDTDDTNAITVSEHALLRYAQLAMGLDLNEVANQILTERFKSDVRACNGNVKLPLDGPEPLKAIIKNYVLVTIIKP